VSKVEENSHTTAQNSDKGRILILYYDRYHTPLEEIRESIGHGKSFWIDLGEHESPEFVDVDVTRIDLKEWFSDNFVRLAIHADARYQEHYNLSAALARPALGYAVLNLINELKFETVVHGFAGNDRLRFETALWTLSPSTKIISAAELLGSRTKANADGHTRSSNIWGETLEAGGLGDPGFSSTDLVFEASEAFDVDLAIDFSEGQPTALDGVAMNLSSLIQRLTELGLRAGVSWRDLVEDGMVGLKTRALYLSPAADILLAAHRDLVRFTSSRCENQFRTLASAAWADLVYNGAWFDPLRSSLDAYFAAADRHVSGTVRVAIRGGQIRVVARTSPSALYDESIAVYRAGEDFGQDLIAGLRCQLTQIGRLAMDREGGEGCIA
jgi:argininosuccinate synthase